jgi:pimeloyl-ACP methyl ester carboxylesterase
MASQDAAGGGPGRFIPANGLDVYYEEYGAGPPLVVLHGGTVTIRQAPTFGARFRVIAPNMRGHGRTANPTGAFSYRLLADDVAALIRALGLERPLVVGYSDGGNTALELGMRYPGIARALVVGGAWLRLSLTYIEGMRQLLGIKGESEPDVDRVEQTHAEWVAAWREAHAALGGPDYWKTLLRQMWPMWMTAHDYSEADFQRITAPTLVLLGDRDETVPTEDAVELYRLIPGAELAIVPAADHLFPRTRQPFYEAVVLDFLVRHKSEGDGVAS